jgi:hypothetical protein
MVGGEHSNKELKIAYLIAIQNHHMAATVHVAITLLIICVLLCALFSAVQLSVVWRET